MISNASRRKKIQSGAKKTIAGQNNSHRLQQQGLDKLKIVAISRFVLNDKRGRIYITAEYAYSSAVASWSWPRMISFSHAVYCYLEITSNQDLSISVFENLNSVISYWRLPQYTGLKIHVEFGNLVLQTSPGTWWFYYPKYRKYFGMTIRLRQTDKLVNTFTAP